jgi:hypothetical protein
MAGRECYHCKQWVEEGEAHDCWTTTEAALTADRVYASHHSIMFSRKSCYFFVRPKRNFLEVCVFLGRAINAPQIRRVDRSSRTKLVHIFRITHRDEVEPPITDWLREAYELSDVLAASKPTRHRATAERTAARSKTARTTAPRTTISRKTSPRKTRARGRR